MFLIPYLFHNLIKGRNVEVNRELEKAVRFENDLEKIKSLLKKGGNPNLRIKKDGTTLLHYAATSEIAEELISHGAEVNARNINGETPLCVAVIQGKDLSLIKTLLSSGADVNVRTVTKETLLHYASYADIVHELLTYGPEIDARNGSGFTPLCTAISEGKELKIVQALLSAGAYASINLTSDRRTPLHFASTAELTKELILFGASVNARDVFSQTPLHVAIEEKKDLSVVQELLRSGADVNAIDSKENTALAYAVTSHSNTNFEVIKELLHYKADITLGQFHSPLHRAVHFNLPCAKLLIKYTLLNNYEGVERQLFRSIIDLDHYSFLCNKLSDFLDECIDEISQMKTDEFNMGQTIYALIKHMIPRPKPLYANYNCIKTEISVKYPIYFDIIWPELKLCLDKAYYIEMLKQWKVRTWKYGNSGREDDIVILDPDSVQEICEYLSDDDLKNLLIAYDSGNQLLSPTDE